MSTKGFRTLLLLTSLLLGCHVLLSVAQPTEEDKLRAAILNPAVVSYELKADVRLTKSLPFFAITTGTVRKFFLFSKKRVTISGARKFVGFRTPSVPLGSGTPAVIEFTISNVNLVRFRANGKTSAAEQALDEVYQGFGSAVRVSGALKISNSRIQDNVGFGDGGAVYVAQGPQVLTNCTFANNQGRFQGGAVAHIAGAQGDFTVQDCTFTNNFANTRAGRFVLARGGAIHLEAQVQTKVTLRRTVFRGNTAASGGAFYTFFAPSSTTPLLFDTCTFESNSVASDIEALGGAILANYVRRLNFIRPVFKNNAVNKKREDILIFWNLPGSTIISGVANSGAVINSNEPGRFTIVS